MTLRFTQKSLVPFQPKFLIAAALVLGPACVAQAQTSSPAMPAAAAANDPMATAVPVAEIVVRINGQIISAQDVQRQQDQLMQQAKEENWTQDQIDAKKKLLLSDLIDQQLLLSKGKELGITGDDELIRQLDEIRKQNHMDSMEDLEKAARSQGVSFEDFKANIRNGIITRKVIQDEVGKTMHLTSSDAEDYYLSHKAEFTQPESVHLSEILIPTGDTDSELASAKARAEKVYDELQKGSDFAEMAKSISTGPTAAQGGDLGVFKRGQLAKELEDKTFALSKGQMTQPIRTRQGFVILKVLQHTPEGLQPYKDVQDQVEQEVYMEKMAPALRAYLTKLRGEAFIDVKPGYVDVNASPNESKPVFSAYTPPQKKAKKKKVNKERFRDKTVMAKDRPPVAPRKRDSDDTVTDAAKKAPAGGPTEVAAKAYADTEKQQAAADSAAPAADSATAAPTPATATAPSPARPVAVNASRPARPRKYKVRYGQGQKAAQLPEGSTDTATQPAETSVEASNTGVQSRLTQESQQMLGTADDKPQKKTRITREPVVSRKQQTAIAAADKKANAPPAADATEVATQAVNSAPLGLNGNTAARQKAKPVAGEKQRIEDQTQVASAASTIDAPQPQPEKKRHKLLGSFNVTGPGSFTHKRFFVEDAWKLGEKPTVIPPSFFLVTACQEKLKKNSDQPYLQLTLSDRTGQIDAKMWDNVEATRGSFTVGDCVAVKAEANKYNGKPQLTVRAIRKAVAEDAKFYDSADFVPTTTRNVDEMWHQLRTTVTSFANPHLRALVNSFLDDPDIAARLRRAPAAKTLHHAWMGGLLEHITSLLSLAESVLPHYPQVDRDLVLTGVVLHDIGKLDELTYENSFGYSIEGQLLGHITIGLGNVQQRVCAIPDFPPRLRLLVEHIILSHHGQYEYGSPKLPMIAEAVMFSMLDDLDAKMQILEEEFKRHHSAGNAGDKLTDWVRALDRPLLDTRRFLAEADSRPAQLALDTTLGDADAVPAQD